MLRPLVSLGTFAIACGLFKLWQSVAIRVQPCMYWRRARVADFGFDLVNYVHATVMTLLSAWVMWESDWRSLNAVSGWLPELDTLASITCGYLSFDLLQVWNDARTQWDYIAFHSVILAGFVSSLYWERGAMVVLLGLFSEADSIVKGHEMMMDVWMHSWRRLRWWHSFAQVLVFLCNRVLLFVFLSWRIWVDHWAVRCASAETAVAAVCEDPAIALQSLLVLVGLGFNTIWCLGDAVALSRPQ